MSEPQGAGEDREGLPGGAEWLKGSLLTSLFVMREVGAPILEVTEDRPIWRMALSVQLDLRHLGEDESLFESGPVDLDEADKTHLVLRLGIRDRITYLNRLGFDFDSKNRQVKIPRPPGKRGPRELLFTPFVGALQKWVRDRDPSAKIEDAEMREKLAPITRKIFGPRWGTTDSGGKLQTAITSTFPGASLPLFEDYPGS